MITEGAITEFLRENWVPALCLLVMVLGVFVLLVAQARREAQWRQNKQRRAMSEWVSREGGVRGESSNSVIRTKPFIQDRGGFETL